jgi:hypothetical protein
MKKVEEEEEEEVKRIQNPLLFFSTSTIND